MNQGAKPGGKIVFASSELPAELDDASRFRQWRDIYAGRYGEADITRLADQPFASRSEFMQVGDVGVIHCAGTFEGYARTARHAAADTRGDFMVGILRVAGSMAVAQRGGEAVLRPGELAFYTNAEAYRSRTDAAHISTGLCVPRDRLLERVANAEDLVMRPVDPSLPAVRHLTRYMDFLLASDELADAPQVAGRVSETLLDLLVLALAGRGDETELASSRGLRAARLQAVLSEIAGGYMRPDLSPQTVAAKLGLSARYVQKLLHESGATFTERVLELRLQQARAMLGNPRHDAIKVSDIAARCGFNDISHFNHCFRRRFGAPPGQFRSR
jgi:AraC-like DNA-binding protein